MTHSTKIDEATIDMTLRRSARNTERFAQARERQVAAEADHQRSRRGALQDEVNDLVDANIKLKDELDEANDLINFWANNSEAFRRTLHHLRENWEPKNGESVDINEIAKQKHTEILASEDWKEERTKTNDDQRKKRREKKARSRQPR